MARNYRLFFSSWKWQWRRQPAKPNIIEESGKLALDHAKQVFVVVCGPEFNMAIPNAGMTSRMGWCRGFEEIGIPYLLISVFDLARRLPELSQPICWISGSDYVFLDSKNLKALKKTRHFVWVNTWFKGDVEYYERNNYPNMSHPTPLNEKIISSEPLFVFTISPEISFEYYDNWIKRGLKLISLPLACDSSVYMAHIPRINEFEAVEMAFVGGYWPYKALQFDRYLLPYHTKLKVFGYSPWPYAGYGGEIPISREAALYRQSKLSPTINEPHVEKMGIDMNERVFKVLGSGGMTITDASSGYRSWFSNDELLVPSSIDEYHDMVQKVLHDGDSNRTYREKGRNAVLSRHTYGHRAKKVAGHLGL